jgi:hypothetical protein
MDHTQHEPLSTADLNESNLINAVIYDPQDNEIGTVAHVHGGGQAAQLIVDVGGFLGIGSKSVALDAAQMNFMRDQNGKVHAVSSLTKEQVEQLPEHHH